MHRAVKYLVAITIVESSLWHFSASWIVATIVNVIVLVSLFFLDHYIKPYAEEAAKQDAIISRVDTLTDKVTTIQQEIGLMTDKKRMRYHQQLEKEYEVYSKISGLLFALVSSTLKLRPTLEMVNPQETHEQIKQRKHADFSSSYNDFVTYYQSNRPFMPEEIYKQLDEIAGSSKMEHIDFSYDITDQQKSESFQKDMVKKLDTIITEFRRRIND
jgi:hypothetical protein